MRWVKETKWIDGEEMIGTEMVPDGWMDEGDGDEDGGKKSRV